MFVVRGITEEQYARIKDSLHVQRGNASLSNPQVLNAILHVAEQGWLSNDSHFEEKVRDVVGLYLNPPERALVLCVGNPVT